jgi:hypothetical protein
MPSAIKCFSLTFLLAALLPLSANAEVIHDPAGDTKARDLDLRTVFVSLRGPTLGFTIIVAAPVRRNSTYSALVLCGKTKAWQIGAESLGQQRDFFLFEFSKSGKQVPVPGTISGRTTTFDGPADKMGCTKGTLKYRIVAQRLTGPALTDKAPKSGYLTLRRLVTPAHRPRRSAPSRR